MVDTNVNIDADSCQYKPVQQDEVEQQEIDVNLSPPYLVFVEPSSLFKAANMIQKKLVLICLFVALGTFGTIAGHHRNLQFVASDAPGENSLLPPGISEVGAANSATGELFDNKIIRTFYGQRFVPDHEYHSVKMFTSPCKRWGVVTTIFDPTEAITRVANMPSWCLVIVPDLKTPDDYMVKLAELQKDVKGNEDGAIGLDNVFYFSLEKQREWENIKGPFGLFVRSTPWKHFCRKNIGYLFAILHGAEYIFDYDDDNFIKIDTNGQPLEILPEQDADEGLVLKDVDVIMQGANAFNHHPIMGASVEESWARGFPIDLIQDKATQGKAAYSTDLPFTSAKKEIGVIQFLADGNPDIDAMHRISKPLPMTFPLDGAHSTLVPTHAYAPYNAQATIHTKNSLWATLLPGTVPGRVSDIWRSYFAQCIFHDTGLQLVFSPPKIVQERNEHNYLGDFNAEQDLYSKSGKLVEFLSDWDSTRQDTVPKIMEQLWIDLYERGYIEINDVYAVQMWLGALHQAGYNFPPLKRRYRNVAVMGQFNYTDKPSATDDVLFWTQKQREVFDTVIAAGPFSDEQMSFFEDNSIRAIANEEVFKPGYFTPLRNFRDVLEQFQDSETIEGVFYAHDDGIMNVTELSRGQYPFPVEEIIGSERVTIDEGGVRWTDVRQAENTELVNQLAYRIFPDGHLEDFIKSTKYDTIGELYEGVPLFQWHYYKNNVCGGGQTRLAMDPDSAEYREGDGSILFSPYAQSDFMFVPTKYASEFIKAADLHLKNYVWIECAFSTTVDMVRQKAGAISIATRLCTDFGPTRGGDPAMTACLKAAKGEGQNFGFIHPYKIARHGYEKWSGVFDDMQ